MSADRAEIITGDQINEYERLRRAVVETRFNDERLLDLFRLSPRLAAFAREYSLMRSPEKAARLAGYAPKTARKNAARLVKKTAPAVQMIRGELLNVGVEFRAGLAEYLANGLLEIFEMRRETPGAAVHAARVLQRLFIDVKNNEPEKAEFEILPPDVDTAAIEEEIRKMGIYD